MTRIAQVGMANPPTSDDRTRWAEGTEYLLSKTKYKLKNPKQDIVNLLYDRDFLKEKRKYEIVVLHSLFEPKCSGRKLSRWDRWAMGVSYWHSLNAWRKRLLQTGAKYILVHESYPMSLNGWSIGELEGYDMDWQAGKRLIVFRKKGGKNANRTRTRSRR